MTQLRLAFYPFEFTDPNNYLSKMREAIMQAYPDTEFVDLPKNLGAVKKIDCVWLNWFENIFGKNLISYIYHALRRLLILGLLKCHGAKIVYTVHNRQPHEMRYRQLNGLFYKVSFLLADYIVVLSDVTNEVIKSVSIKASERKIIKIPHPAYTTSPKIYPEKSGPFSVLFFGMIRPYKNIEMILTVAKNNPGINFVIAGAAIDPNYALYINSAADNISNVRLLLHRLTDEEINTLMDEASVLALPYDLKSSLNSGAAMFALSKGLNVVIPNIGTVLELSNRDKVYGYDYNQDSEHQAKFEKALMRAYDDFTSDYRQFVRNSEILREEVLSSNSTEKLSKIIMKLNLKRGGVSACELAIYECITMPLRHTDFEVYARA